MDLYIVGSSLNGLGTNTSDLDICLVYNESEPWFQVINKLRSIKTMLSENRKFCNWLVKKS